MMEGLENEWNYVRNRRFVTYTTLPAGDYTFRVKGTNNDGVWNEEGTSLKITITPPFWQTWWFRASVIITILGAAFGTYRVRIRNIEAQKRKLETQVAERTSEIRAQRDEIVEQKERILDQQDEIHEMRVRSIELQNKQLEEKVRERTSELEATQKELIEKAHQAGMAEVATGTLHNIGNSLNSVNTSVTVIHEVLENPNLDGFVRANALLRDNLENLEDFISTNPKGKKLIQYYLKLEERLLEDHSVLKINAQRAIEKITGIHDSITVQQNRAKGNLFSESLSLTDIIEEVLNLQADSLASQHINIERKFIALPEVMVQKAKLVQILINLYKNASEAMEDVASDSRKLIVAVDKDDVNAYIKITDNGCGIDPENLHKMFTYGFTTKAYGHGFGLNSCAKYMSEIGGEMAVESEGQGKGATFVLSFPLSDS